MLTSRYPLRVVGCNLRLVWNSACSPLAMGLGNKQDENQCPNVHFSDLFHENLVQAFRKNALNAWQIKQIFMVLLIQSKPFIWVGRNISALVVGLYQKTKATLWSPTSRDLSDSTVGSPLNSTRKKLQRLKLKKSQMAPWKWHFSPHDFLGLQQSLLKY